METNDRLDYSTQNPNDVDESSENERSVASNNNNDLRNENEIGKSKSFDRCESTLRVSSMSNINSKLADDPIEKSNRSKESSNENYLLVAKKNESTQTKSLMRSKTSVDLTKAPSVSGSNLNTNEIKKSVILRSKSKKSSITTVSILVNFLIHNYYIIFSI